MFKTYLKEKSHFIFKTKWDFKILEYSTEH